MNRRLHTTFLALAACGSMLTLILVAGVPAPVVAPGIPGENPQLTRKQTTPEPAAEVAEAAEAPRPGRGSHARSRQSVVMPYFSFARRG